MLPTTFAMFRAVIKVDNTITPADAKRILDACKPSRVANRQINAREAMEILQVSRPTLRKLVKNGNLQQINLSSRRVRFNEAAVRELAANGVVAI
ncbi:MAG: helix-turn-helix domain-containing protein [Victivallaceae bacterium]|nr:helix-turn-helix domain-containing protein [Victivallaceae bacterium]